MIIVCVFKWEAKEFGTSDHLKGAKEVKFYEKKERVGER